MLTWSRADVPFGHDGLPGSVLDVLLGNGVALEHACGGVCACTTCHVILRVGESEVSPMRDDEADRLDLAEGLTLRSRLACQCVVVGDGEVVVEIPTHHRNRPT